MTNPEKRCPICSNPIPLSSSFCRPHWSELPTPLKDQITLTHAQKNFFAKARAVQQALDWLNEHRRLAKKRRRC
jgi:hypothetical protein